jgi:hypothetical protein
VRGLAIPALGTSTAEDTNLDTMIARADGVLAGWCGYPPAAADTAAGGNADRTLESFAYTDYLDGPSVRDPRALALRVRPLTLVTSVHDDRDRDWSYGAADLVAASNYVVDYTRGRIYLPDNSTHGDWSVGRRVIKVIYTAGFNTGADVAITQAISMLVAHWWAFRKRTGLEGYTSSDGVTVAVTPPVGIPEHVKEMFAPYRLPEVGLG